MAEPNGSSGAKKFEDEDKWVLALFGDPGLRWMNRIEKF